MRTRARSLSSFGQARVTASSPPDIPTVLHSSRSGCGGAVELTKKPGYRSGRNNRQPKYPPGSLADPALPVGNRTAGTKCRRDAHPNGAKRVRVMWRGRATGPKGAAAPAAAGEHCLSSPPPWALRHLSLYWTAGPGIENQNRVSPVVLQHQRAAPSGGHSASESPPFWPPNDTRCGNRRGSADQRLHFRFEFPDRPAVVLLDALRHRPVLEQLDRPALHEEHLAGGRAVLGRQVGDQRRDVGRVPDVELSSVLGRGNDVAQAGRGFGEPGAS